MKTTDITRALRNSTTPAARLADWHNRPLSRRRDSLASYYVKTATLTERHKARISESGPEISSPEAGKLLLWFTGTKDPQISDWTAGRDFLDHHGFYTDEYQDRTIETYAVTLKAFPRIVFYAVLSEGGLRVELSDWEEIDFSECESDHDADDARKDAAREIIHSNDSTTEREAEYEREYQRKWSVENEIQENKETLKGLRSEIRTLARELKTLCPPPLATEYPAAGKAVRDSLKLLLMDRRELMESNEELAASL